MAVVSVSPNRPGDGQKSQRKSSLDGGGTEGSFRCAFADYFDGSLWANFTGARCNAEHSLQYRACLGLILGIWHLKCFYKTMPDTFSYDDISIIELFRVTSGDSN